VPVANIQLQASVRQALDWDLEDDARHIAVSTETGAVTLSGYVSSFFTKAHAVKTAQGVFGARAIADEIEVRLGAPIMNDDPAIAAVIARTFESNIHLAKFNLTARVANGHVTIAGTVNMNDERDEAKREVARIQGVLYVLNDISVKPRVTGGEVKSQIDDALSRHGANDACHIHVAVSGSTAVLSGHLCSLDEARIARSVASRVPGITRVENHFCIIR
jgi:osmotically-inducible protein OsmY